jgi:membrane-associated phospholipid phosphatase
VPRAAALTARAALAALAALPIAAAGWAPAQTADSSRRAAAITAAVPELPGGQEWLAGAALVAAAALLDRPARDASLDHRSRALDDVARAGNAMGRGVHLIPAMGAAYLGARVAHRRGLAGAVARTAAAYAAANVVASALKPAVGRHRPDSGGGPGRFRPFATSGEWHAFPSAHAIHAFAIAGAVSDEARNPWVTAAAFAAAGVVGWSRVYADEHWLSDVAAGGALGVLTARTVTRLLRRRGRDAPTGDDPPDGEGEEGSLELRPIVAPGRIGLRLSSR